MKQCCHLTFLLSTPWISALTLSLGSSRRFSDVTFLSVKANRSMAGGKVMQEE